MNRDEPTENRIFSKLKTSLFFSKRDCEEDEKQATGWEKTFAKFASDESPESGPRKEL